MDKINILQVSSMDAHLQSYSDQVIPIRRFAIMPGRMTEKFMRELNCWKCMV